MQLSRLSTRLGILALSPLFALGCGGTSPAGTTSFSVKLKDAPGDFVNAVVTVSEVSLIGTGGRLVLRSDPVTTDLLTLAASTADLVQGVTIPSGTYSEMRFVISGACLSVERAGGGVDVYATDGYVTTPCGGPATGRLQTPSLASSGLKVKFDNDADLVVEGEQQIVIVDFDVRQSFGRLAGNSNQWVMRPVVKGAYATVTGGLTVGVRLGTGFTLPVVNGVATSLGGFSAVLLNSPTDTAAVLPLTDTDADGVFTAGFIFVAPGSYSVGLRRPAVLSAITTTEVLPVPVTVLSNTTATASITVTGATVAPPTP
jgi:hypothetical protein